MSRLIGQDGPALELFNIAKIDPRNRGIRNGNELLANQSCGPGKKGDDAVPDSAFLFFRDRFLVRQEI